MPHVRLKVKQGKDGQWYPRIQSANGQIVLVGEGYSRKGDAIRGLANATHAIGEAVQGFPAKAIGHALIETVGVAAATRTNGRVVK
jgi:uncharacterized protein YegP (UPF0339 family)